MFVLLKLQMVWYQSINGVMCRQCVSYDRESVKPGTYLDDWSIPLI